MFFPVWGHIAASHTDPVGNAFDQASRTRTEAVVLEAVDQFVGEDATDFVGDAVRRDAGNVLEAKVDFLVVFVQVAARRIGYSGHAAELEGDGPRGRHGRGGI